MTTQPKFLPNGMRSINVPVDYEELAIAERAASRAADRREECRQELAKAEKAEVVAFNHLARLRNAIIKSGMVK